MELPDVPIAPPTAIPEVISIISRELSVVQGHGFANVVNVHKHLPPILGMQYDMI